MQKQTFRFILSLLVSLLIFSSIIFMMKALVLENSHNQVAKEFKGEIFSEQLISLPDGEIAQAQLSDDGNKALFLLNEQGKDQIYFWENKLGYQKINIDSLKVISNIAFTGQLFFLLAKDDTGKVGLYVWELGFGLNRVGKLELQGSWGITLAKGLADLIIFAKSKDSFAIADDKSKLTSLIHLKLKGHMEEGRYLTFGQRESKLSYEIVSSHSGNISTEAIAGNSLLNTLELDRNKTAVLKKIKLRDSIKFDVNGDKREDLLGFENISQMPLWRAYTYDGYNSSSDTSLSRSGINLNWRVGDGKGVPVAGDYNGDGVLDLATFTPGNGFSNSDSIGQWQIYYSMPYSLRDTYLNPTQGYVTYQLGTNTALPVPADYDGDGITDIAVYDPSNTQWQIIFSSGGNDIAKALGGYKESGALILFGENNALPVKGDVDGDGADDIILYTEATEVKGSSEWNVLFSSAKFEIANKNKKFQFGSKGEVPFTADFDGDGKNELVVFNPQSCGFKVRFNAENVQEVSWPSCLNVSFGYSEDLDGDGRADFILSSKDKIDNESTWRIYTSNFKADAYDKFPSGWNIMTTIKWGGRDIKSVQELLYLFYKKKL